MLKMGINKLPRMAGWTGAGDESVCGPRRRWRSSGFAELEHLCPSPLPPMAMAFRTSSSQFCDPEMMGTLDGSSQSAIMGGSLAHSNQHLVWNHQDRFCCPTTTRQNLGDVRSTKTQCCIGIQLCWSSLWLLLVEIAERFFFGKEKNPELFSASRKMKCRTDFPASLVQHG